MMCLKHIMLFSLLLPMPAASPLFLCLFAASLFFSIRPCGYCLALFAILFLSTSPNSPFITPSPSPTLTPSNITDKSASSTSTVESTISNLLDGLPLDAPVPGRTWLSMNAGRVFDPNLVGYRQLAQIQAQARAQASQRWNRRISSEEGQQMLNEDDNGRKNREKRSSLKGLINRIRRLITVLSDIFNGKNKTQSPKDLLSSPTIRSKESPLPPGYVDLSWRGVGFIVDFGWKRSEEGLLWEISRLRDSLELGQVEQKVELEEKEREEALVSGFVDVDGVPREEERIQENDMVHKSRNGFRWGIPLLGNW